MTELELGTVSKILTLVTLYTKILQKQNYDTKITHKQSLHLKNTVLLAFTVGAFIIKSHQQSPP